MATTLLDARRRATQLHLMGLFGFIGAMGGAQGVLAQTGTTPTASVTPSVATQVSYSDNATQATAGKEQPDTIVSVTPGLAVQYNGPNTSVTGQMRLSAVRYLNETQSDRLLPNGNLALNTELSRLGLGLDASVSATQVKSQFGSAQAAGTSTSDTYTNTRVRISPYLARDIDANTQLRANLERTQLRSTANSTALANRPDTTVTGAGFSLVRRPTRLGYALDARYQDTQAEGQDQSLYTQRLVRGTALYAVLPELQVGLTIGRESSDVLLQSYRNTLRGVQLDWRPTARTDIRALAEERFFGRAWTGELSHRLSHLTFGLTTRRQVDTYATASGASQGTGGSTQAMLDALLTNRIPNEAERAKAVSDLIAQRNLPAQLGSGRDLYNLNTLIRQNTVARVSWMGPRSIFLASVGQTRTQPLPGDAYANILGTTSNTRDRFADVQLNHRLSPHTNASVGLRMSRATSNNTLLGTMGSSRSVGLRLNMSTALSPRTQVVWGFRRVRTTGASQDSTVTENLVFAGLEHRF